MKAWSLSSVSSEGRRWLVVALFAVAMAWVESAVVFDLRTMTNRIQPHQPNPLPEIGALGSVELVREAATLIMLLTVGCLAGRHRIARLGYAAVAFGIWDIFYYVFLRILTGWPASLFDWDILFLIPLPWWGPVLAPVSIAILMITWGTLVTQFEVEKPTGTRWAAWLLAVAGAFLALYVFMADAIGVADRGGEAIRRVLPGSFHWSLFAVAWVLMAAPVAEAGRQLWQRRALAIAELEPS